MDNIIEFNDFSSPESCALAETCCWLCQKGNSMRAFFCQHCGTIQPVRPIDHFARLGHERQIDIDLQKLDRQYTNLHQSFSPDRFKIRGLGERGHAAGQLSALEEAYLTLRNPLGRARYWIELHKQDISPIATANPMVDELKKELEQAKLVSQCDRVAQKAGHALEQGIVGLMQALRNYNWPLANSLLSELSDLEIVLKGVHETRTKLASTAPHEDNVFGKPPLKDQ